MSEPLIVRARIAAPVKDVHTALTDPDALRTWLAEHAEVQLPDRYEFWGRYTPEGDAPHQRLLHVDDDTLRFSWLLDDEETTTEFRLDADSDGSTIVTLSQSHFTFADALSGATIRGVLQTYWALGVANLAAYAEGRELMPRVDFTSTDLRGDMLIDAPVDAVYASLTTSEQASAWFGFPIGIEPWVGGRFAMGGFDSGDAAKILELEPRRKMTTDWGPVGVTTWELAESGGRTRLTFVQSGFDTGRPPYAAWGGWLAGLSELRRFHEVPNWQPIWLAPEATGIPEQAPAAG